jgi:hypothetical protein
LFVLPGLLNPCDLELVELLGVAAAQMSDHPRGTEIMVICAYFLSI